VRKKKRRALIGGEGDLHASTKKATSKRHASTASSRQWKENAEEGPEEMNIFCSLVNFGKLGGRTCASLYSDWEGLG